MVITPNSKIKLIKNPLKLDSNNEIMFESKTTQYNYFNSLPKIEFENLTYVRKEGVLRVETNNNLTYEDLLGYNFCMYQNTYFDEKWFYAYVTDITWINPSLTEIKLETAYYQTWQFDLVYMDSYIEREHVDDDTIGLHTLPENLELGEPVQAFNPEDFYAFNNFYMCIALTELPPAFQYTNQNRMYNGIYSGLNYLIFNDPIELSDFIRACDESGKADVISSLFMIPTEFNPNPTWIEGTMAGYSFLFSYLTNSNTASILRSSINISRAERLAYTYYPTNNKLLTYPFSYMNITNNCGTDVIFRYEDFRDVQPVFSIVGSLTPGCSIKAFPLNYKRAYDNNTDYSFNFGISAGKFPVCSWNSDVYTNWLTQQGANLLVGEARDEINIIGSLATGNVQGVVSGFEGIQNRMLQQYQHSLIPNQAKGNLNSGDVIFSSGNLKFTAYHMSIRKENAKMIDSYFNMFGYKVNRLGKPHLHVRTYYDYIKTIDVNIEGNIPEKDLDEIRKMFNNGIRFWHNTSKYLDFSVNNSIITP